MTHRNRNTYKKPPRNRPSQGIINALQAVGVHWAFTRKRNKRGANVDWRKRHVKSRIADVVADEYADLRGNPNIIDDPLP